VKKKKRAMKFHPQSRANHAYKKQPKKEERDSFSGKSENGRAQTALRRSKKGGRPAIPGKISGPEDEVPAQGGEK